MFAFRDLAVATHLVGLIFWMGGIVVAAMIAASAAREGEAGRATIAAARRAVLMVATPGMLLAWIAGLAYLVPNFTTLYARAGWMHGKLTLIVVLSALTGVLSGRLRRTASGAKPASAGFFGGFALAILAASAIVVFLAVLKPGS